MKEAIIALDGGGSNLRMIVVDKETEEELYFKEINTGTNLSTVPNREQALNNIKRLIANGYSHMPSEYTLVGIGLSSAGTEIKGTKEDLEKALREVVETLKTIPARPLTITPKLYVTNDIDVLLHSADIALVAGTGTVGAVKYKDIQPYDNTTEIPEEYTIEKLDAAGPYIGDKGSGYWIGKEVLTKVQEIETLKGYVNPQGEFVEEYNSYLRELVLKKLFELNGISGEEAEKAIMLGLDYTSLPEFVSLVYSATEENGKPFDRAKVGNYFSKLADDAAIQGDTAANEILKAASIELFKNIKTAYEKGGFADKPECMLLLSGSVLVHSKIVRFFLENTIKDYYPNIIIKINKEKPVQSTVKYVKQQLGKSKVTPDFPEDNGGINR